MDHGGATDRWEEKMGVDPEDAECDNVIAVI